MKKDNKISDEEISTANEENPIANEENPVATMETTAAEVVDVAAKKKDKKKRRWHNPFRLYIIDLYILKKFLGTFFLSTMLFLAVIAMFDITEKLDAFLTAPLSETIFDYFFSFIPYFANQLIPLFVFIAVIFFTSKMAANSEIIAILSSGISFSRLLRPYMIGAAIIAAMTFALSNYIIPPTNIKRIAYTNKYVKNKKVESNANVQLQVSPGVVAFIGRFEDRNKTGYRFSLDKFDGKELKSRTTAMTARYDTTRTYHWILMDYMTRDFDGMKETIKRGRNSTQSYPLNPATS